MRKVFIILGWCVLLVWVVFYWLTSSLECAFEARHPCGHLAPWAMPWTDFLYLWLLPGLITVGLFTAAWRTGRDE